MATADDIRTTISSYVERFCAGDRDGWLSLFDDDATVEDPVGSEVLRGRAEIRGLWDFAHSVSASVQLRLSGPVKVVGHEAAFVQTIVTPVGDTAFALEAIDVMSFSDDASIKSMRAFWDMADVQPLPDAPDTRNAPDTPGTQDTPNRH